MSATHILDVYETKVGFEFLKVLSKDHYCVVKDPVDENGVNQIGIRELRRGPITFFLKPMESLEGGTIKNVEILGKDESLLIKAVENCSENGQDYNSGD